MNTPDNEQESSEISNADDDQPISNSSTENAGQQHSKSEAVKGKHGRNLSKKRAEEEYQLLKTLAKSITQRANKVVEQAAEKQNAVSAFGKYVAESLDDLEPFIRMHAQHEINNIIFKAQMGMLDQGSVATHFQDQPTSHFQPRWMPNSRHMQGPMATSQQLRPWMTSTPHQPAFAGHSSFDPLYDQDLHDSANSNFVEE